VIFVISPHSDTVSRWNKAQDFPHDGASTLRNLCVGAEEGDTVPPLVLSRGHALLAREEGRKREATFHVRREKSECDSSRAQLWLPRAISVLFCHQVTRHTIYISARPRRHAPAHANCVTKRFIIAVVPSKVGDERTSHGTPTGEIAMAAGARLRSCSVEKPRGTGMVPPGIASG